MAKNLSALEGHLSRDRKPRDGTVGISLSQINTFSLVQISAWPDSLQDVGAEAAKMAGCDAAPEPGRSAFGTSGTLLRTEPLKWWLLNGAENISLSDYSSSQLSILDFSHSRTRISLSGPKVRFLLNNFLPLDFSDARFPSGSVASSALHHVGVTLWRTEDQFNLFVPRSFAASHWELLVQSADQYGYEVEMLV